MLLSTKHLDITLYRPGEPYEIRMQICHTPCLFVYLLSPLSRDLQVSVYNVPQRSTREEGAETPIVELIAKQISPPHR